ncbi:MAG: glycosyltransferase family 2 protein [Acidobacteriota bacterium]
MKKLSIVIPVYNEVATVAAIVGKLEALELGPIEKEIILVDDGSTDGTRPLLEGMRGRHNVILHEKNHGKGGAIATGITAATGDYLLVQDADLEYEPGEIPKLLKPVLEGRAVVVYGSRFTGERKNMFFHHYVGNKFLTFLTDFLYNTSLSDMETCYKLVPIDLVRSLELRAKRFNFEPEITAKILKRRVRIYEVPISYTGREFEEGKKITWRDGFAALWTLLKYRFTD